MIKKVTVINYLGESLEMPMDRPQLSGFAICSIGGLGPVKANVNVTELATDDGAVYNSARAETRNITLSLKFMDYIGHGSAEDIRLLSYKYFPLKKPLTLIIETDNRIASITGYVESNEPDIFSADERTNISILCPDPWFYDADGDGNKETRFNGIENLFEFPVENEPTYEENQVVETPYGRFQQAGYILHVDLTLGSISYPDRTYALSQLDAEFHPMSSPVSGNFKTNLVFDVPISTDKRLSTILFYTYDSEGRFASVDWFTFEPPSVKQINQIEMGSYKGDKVGNIYYEGDVEIGFVIELSFSGNAENIVLYNVTSNETMVIATSKITALTGSALTAGDTIIIDSRRGQKKAQLLRGGRYYNILNSLGRNTAWLMLHKGDNYIGYGAESGEDNITVLVTNKTAFEGV